MGDNLPTKVDDNVDPLVKDDFDYARATVYNLADKSQEAIELMMDLARESEHPRAFEVLSNMIKQNAELASQLLDMQQQKQKLMPAAQQETSQITNNNVFVGTTEELQRLFLKDIDHED